MHVASLHIHPLKSAAALDVDTLEIVARGAVGDRRWMVIDAADRFVTARAEARLVLIRALPQGEGLMLSAPGTTPLCVAAPTNARRIVVRIWNDHVGAVLADEDAHAWLSAFLGRPVRLVYMDSASRRAVDPVFGAAGDEVSFADGYPLLVISGNALHELNARLADPISMTRFRPNIVIEQCAPHAEDGWRRVRIGTVAFDAVKTCTRCVFTTIDPATAIRDAAGEPLTTLRTYRRAEVGNDVLFGMNLIARGEGTLRLGDPVEVLELR
ncbi:MAG: MOSC N-terminal beta barrel domain-containing protein [Lysobacterales bacterium]